MTTKKTELPDYWSIYKAINFKRFSKDREYTDKKTGKTMTYSFVGAEKLNSSIFMQLFSGLLWMSPAFLIVLISIVFSHNCPIHYFYGVIALIIYHFAAMYYVIRGPHLEITEVKKKGLFSR